MPRVERVWFSHFLHYRLDSIMHSKPASQIFSARAGVSAWNLSRRPNQKARSFGLLWIVRIRGRPSKIARNPKDRVSKSLVAEFMSIFRTKPCPRNVLRATDIRAIPLLPLLLGLKGWKARGAIAIGNHANFARYDNAYRTRLARNNLPWLFSALAYLLWAIARKVWNRCPIRQHRLARIQDYHKCLILSNFILLN
jgi:hypothetical protein